MWYILKWNVYENKGCVLFLFTLVKYTGYSFQQIFLFAVIVCYPTNKHFLVFVTFNLSNLFFPIQQTIRKQQHSLKFVYKTKNCELSYSIITQCLRLEIPPNETKEGKISKINKWNLNLFSPYRDRVPTWNYNVNTK